MYLDYLAKIICLQGTAACDRKITVKTFGGRRTIWEGMAKDLHTMPNIKGWLVVEVLIDYSDDSTAVDYNKGKIIIVI